MNTFLWLAVVAGGPVLLGVVIAYGMLMRRRLSRREEQARHDATDQIYERR